MGLIPCTDNCVYQEDGYCTLERAASRGEENDSGECIHFISSDKNVRSK